MKTINGRKIEYEVNKIFPSRWSPRAMSGEKITLDQMMSLFEAARWAPSSYNNQPWIFVYAFRETEHWKKLFDLLVDFNKMWVKNAAALILVVSKKTFYHNNQPSPSHSFDTGAATQNLALQGSLMGLVVHTIGGFDYEKARKEFGISEDYQIEAMVAVGKPGKKEDLPLELQERETPSGRKKVSEFAFEGKFIEKTK